jgi:hypothetical protein
MSPHLRGLSLRARAAAALLAALAVGGLAWLLRGAPVRLRAGATPVVSILVRVSGTPLPLKESRQNAGRRPVPSVPKHSGQAAMARTHLPLPSVPSVQTPTRTAEMALPTLPEVGPSAPASAPPALDLGAEVLRSAARQSKGAVRALADASGQSLGTHRPNRDEVFSAAVAEAGVPSCLRGDALKHDPPAIGPVPLGGIFALPFVAHAVIEGKCKP